MRAAAHAVAAAVPPPALSILQCLDDPELFAPHFRGGTWGPWRAFLAALFGLRMTAAELDIYRQCTARQEAPTVAAKEAVLRIGRRGGKSRVLALIACYLACFRDYSEYLAPGEFATIAVIAADRRQARTIFSYAIGLLKAVPLLSSLIVEDTTESITLSNFVRIEIATASFRVTRGYTFAAILADECAFWRDDQGANPDVEIIKAVRPGLATIPGAMLLLASSPYRKRGILHALDVKHYGRDGARCLVWVAPTLVMNPALDPAVVAEAYEDDPESAASEYGAGYRNDLTDFVPRAVVDAATFFGRFEIAPIRGVHYVAFVDPSGGTGADSMTLAIAHKEGARAVLDAIREVRPPFSPKQVVANFAVLIKSYGIYRVTGDRYGGDFPRELFRDSGVAYDLSEQPKSDIYRDFLPLLNSGGAELLDNPRLSAQLGGLERRTARGGRDSIDHAPGAHDDIANVAAGALLLASERPPQPARAIRINLLGR